MTANTARMVPNPPSTASTFAIIPHSFKPSYLLAAFHIPIIPKYEYPTIMKKTKIDNSYERAVKTISTILYTILTTTPYSQYVFAKP